MVPTWLPSYGLGIPYGRYNLENFYDRYILKILRLKYIIQIVSRFKSKYSKSVLLNGGDIASRWVMKEY